MESNPQPIEFTGQEPPENTWAFLAFAWRRKGLVLFAMITGLGLGYLYFLQQEPRYQSTSQILIVEERAKLPIEGVDVSTSSDQLHMTLLQSQRVVQLAVEKLNDGPLATVRSSPIREAEVMGGFSVSGSASRYEISSQAGILKLSYESANRQECPLVLDAIVNSYSEFLDEMYNKASDDTIDLIEQAQKQLETQITTAEKAFRAARDASSLIVTGETAQNIHEMRLQQIEEVRSESMLENSKLRAQIDALTKALEQGGSREALNLIVGQIESTGALAGKTGTPADPIQQRNLQLFPILLEEQMLLENHGPDHPKVLALRKRIELTRQFLAKGATPDDPLIETQDYYEIYVESLREKIKMNDRLITEMDVQFENESTNSKKLLSHLLAEETYRSEIDRKSRLFDVVLRRLEEINLTKDRGGAEVESIHSPGLASQTKPDFNKTMLTSGILALLSGLVLAFVVDAADRRFRSPDEIRNELGVPVVGHIPVMHSADKNAQEVAENGSRIVPEVRTVHTPRGRIAEAYRAVRTAIYFSTRGGGHQVIQVTSPNSGDGKTTLASNLAVSIANSGKRVLLIDADFRRPRCHSVFGAENKVGMSGVIEGTVEILDAVQTTEVENLSLLTCGKRPKNPSELLTSRRFEELLDVLRAQFELVIVDTPPVLAVTDPLNVAPRVDGVLLVLRLTKSARHAGHRTLDSLEEIGANVLGVVVNGVGGGAKYGEYGYSQGRRYSGYGGYGYRYGDAYGCRESNDQSYYGDEASDNNENEERLGSTPTDNNGKH